MVVGELVHGMGGLRLQALDREGAAAAEASKREALFLIELAHQIAKKEVHQQTDLVELR